MRKMYENVFKMDYDRLVAKFRKTDCEMYTFHNGDRHGYTVWDCDDNTLHAIMFETDDGYRQMELTPWADELMAKNREHIEEVIYKITESAEVLLDYTKELIEYRHCQEDVHWPNGADDSFYDYIPNGLDFLSRIAWLTMRIHNSMGDVMCHKTEEENEIAWQNEVAGIRELLMNDYPYAQDATPNTTRLKLLEIAKMIGVPIEWLRENYHIEDDEDDNGIR